MGEKLKATEKNPLNEKKKRRRLRISLYTAGIAAALILVLYPLFSQLWNQHIANLRVAEYEETVSSSEIDYEYELSLAQNYNESLVSSNTSSLFDEGMTETEKYEAVLNLSGDGMMGTLIIPDINLKVPIYHYVTDEVLEKGIGHLDSSSLPVGATSSTVIGSVPVGGQSTHTVLTGHRGLPSSVLFTDLDKLEIGDVFYIEVLSLTLAYEVYEIEVVLPEETQSLAIQTGKDLCTLVTCTPYGINTHRLLVHAERTDYTEEDEEIIESTNGVTVSWYLAVIALIEVVFYVYLVKSAIRDKFSKN